MPCVVDRILEESGLCIIRSVMYAVGWKTVDREISIGYGGTDKGLEERLTPELGCIQNAVYTRRQKIIDQLRIVRHVPPTIRSIKEGTGLKCIVR